MTKCGVCLHPARDAIEASLAAGASQRAMGRQYGMSHHVVRRHVSGGHSAPAAGASPTSSPPPGAPGSAYQQMKQVTDAMSAIDYSKLSPREQVVQLENYARALTRLHQMEPPSVHTRPESEREVDRLREIVQATARALRGHPAARQAVSQAVQRLRAMSK